MTITAPQQAALEKAAVRTVYFVEFYFQHATLRINTTNRTITWGSSDWTGLGSVSNISTLEESEGLESKSLSFTLNVTDTAWLALAVGVTEEYRGRAANMYFCPLDESFNIIDTPTLCWSGIMDTVCVGINGEEGSIILKCETAAYGLKRQPSLRLNSAQHKLKHPSDTGFDYLTDLIANPVLWLSKKFQTK